MVMSVFPSTSREWGGRSLENLTAHRSLKVSRITWATHLLKGLVCVSGEWGRLMGQLVEDLPKISEVLSFNLRKTGKEGRQRGPGELA